VALSEKAGAGALARSEGYHALDHAILHTNQI
jgi:hypothetical protein